MRSIGIVMAGALCLWAGAASAGPRADGLLAAPALPLVDVHHKPGHKGGPPWMRENRSRDAWREGRRDSRRSYSERRTECRTTYRTYIDDYTGEYVRRSVRVCD